VDSGIDAIDSDLSRWIAETVPGVSVSFGAAAAEPKSPVVHLLLQRLADTTGARAKAGQPTPRRLELGYFVAVNAREPSQAHRVLGELLFAALERGERGDWRVSFEVPAAELWTSHQLLPQPTFLLQIPLLRARPTPPMKYVREIVLKAAPAVPFEGLLLDPADHPLADVLVELGGLDQRTRTDGNGRFRFGAVPSDLHQHSLRVHAKGRAFDLVAERARPGVPCVIRLEIMQADAGPRDLEN
jgi:hypothetical protein